MYFLNICKLSPAFILKRKIVENVLLIDFIMSCTNQDEGQLGLQPVNGLRKRHNWVLHIFSNYYNRPLWQRIHVIARCMLHILINYYNIIIIIYINSCSLCVMHMVTRQIHTVGREELLVIIKIPCSNWFIQYCLKVFINLLKVSPMSLRILIQLFYLHSRSASQSKHWYICLQSPCMWYPGRQSITDSTDLAMCSRLTKLMKHSQDTPADILLRNFPGSMLYFYVRRPPACIEMN